MKIAIFGYFLEKRVIKAVFSIDFEGNFGGSEKCRLTHGMSYPVKYLLVCLNAATFVCLSSAIPIECPLKCIFLN